MLAMEIIKFVLAIIIYVVGGIVCGRICVEIIDKKRPDFNVVMWFWAGFFFNVVAVFMTLCVKEKKND